MKIILPHKLFFVSILFCNCTFCNAQDNPIKLRINPVAALGGTVSQFIQKINFITFENTKESTFSAIDQIEVTEKEYIILDQETNSILIFKKPGRFHSKIEIKKLQKDFNLNHFYIQRNSSQIEIQSYLTTYIFNTDGKLVKKTIYKNAKAQELGDKEYFSNKSTFHYSYKPDRNAIKDSISFEVYVSDEMNKIQKKYFPYSIKNASLQSDEIMYSIHRDSYPDYSQDTTIYYLRPYEYNIYKLTPRTIETAYKFVFPLQNSLPINFNTDSSFNDKRKLYLKENTNIIYRLCDFYKTANNLFFKTMSSKSENAISSSFIYNTNSSNLISINKIISDSTSYFLPITDAELGGYFFKTFGLINFDGTYFYTSYPSSVLFNQMEATQNKNPKYPPELIKYFSNPKNKRGNPMLIQIQFKPNL